jgi:uncharacterized protein YdeI (YjbR/CyaY-like superfamily)
MGYKNPLVDEFIRKTKNWREETEKLRLILLDCGMEEDIKWGKPCYSLDHKNIAVIQGFKDYFALLFFNGYLLDDPHHILVKTGENTRVGRQIRFRSVEEIIKLEPILKTYILQAIRVEKSDLKSESKPLEEIQIPQELRDKLENDPFLKKAFEGLSPGKQRGYQIFISQAKQSKTREDRIEKCIEKIMIGKGINE